MVNIARSDGVGRARRARRRRPSRRPGTVRPRDRHRGLAKYAEARSTRRGRRLRCRYSPRPMFGYCAPPPGNRNTTAPASTRVQGRWWIASSSRTATASCVRRADRGPRGSSKAAAPGLQRVGDVGERGASGAASASASVGVAAAPGPLGVCADNTSSWCAGRRRRRARPAPPRGSRARWCRRRRTS